MNRILVLLRIYNKKKKPERVRKGNLNTILSLFDHHFLLKTWKFHNKLPVMNQFSRIVYIFSSLKNFCFLCSWYDFGLMHKINQIVFLVVSYICRHCYAHFQSFIIGYFLMPRLGFLFFASLNDCLMQLNS